jgi:hypothetical protein
LCVFFGFFFFFFFLLTQILHLQRIHGIYAVPQNDDARSTADQTTYAQDKLRAARDTGRATDDTLEAQTDRTREEAAAGDARNAHAAAREANKHAKDDGEAAVRDGTRSAAAAMTGKDARAAETAYAEAAAVDDTNMGLATEAAGAALREATEEAARLTDSNRAGAEARRDADEKLNEAAREEVEWTQAEAAAEQASTRETLERAKIAEEMEVERTNHLHANDMQEVRKGDPQTTRKNVE